MSKYWVLITHHATDNEHFQHIPVECTDSLEAAREIKARKVRELRRAKSTATVQIAEVHTPAQS